MNSNQSKGSIATGIVAALAASSCCIPPLIAGMAGVGGSSMNLSLMEPYRPYLIGLAVIAIAYAWYNHLKPKKVDDCGCDDETTSFLQSRGFLIGMTLFASLSITFPYYSGIFYAHNNAVTTVDSTHFKKINVLIEGMTCDACEHHVNQAVNELAGIGSVVTYYDEGNSIITFDDSKTTVEKIEEAINSSGYETLTILPNGN